MRKPSERNTATSAMKNTENNVLRFFLQIPNIYATKDLRNELEARARENISREIQLLESNARTY
ncbi:hypothetical protein ANCDUO_05308 [Ancylostoma duodenale]|uniref:Uncharacterized protein n=1 Tax=Ancylostoma duodenale TaxID=51022 RepID=A0A0C2GZ04_9BILA|nr:hypothetical protein ANCDUO_05308 [Ancylostoma duodenale]